MDPELVELAEELGINVSMYLLLEPQDREKALRKDVRRALKNAEEGKKHD